MSDDKVLVYALACPDTNEIRYIGKTQDIKSRYRNHFIENQNPEKLEWVNLLVESGKQPTLIILEEVDKSEQYKTEDKWIKYYRSGGCKLFNKINSSKSNRKDDFLSMTIRLSPDTMNWLKRQANNESRSTNKQIEHYLDMIRKEDEKTRYHIGSALMCHNGMHRFKSLNPAINEFCNCGVYVYGEVVR